MAKKVKPITDLSPEATKIYNDIKQYLTDGGVYRVVDDSLIKDYARLSDVKSKTWDIAKDNPPVWTADSGYTQIEGSHSTYLKLLDKQVALGQLLGIGPVARQKVDGLAANQTSMNDFEGWKATG